jgi:Periplasmic copper-binding protein (NosD)
MNRYLTQFVLSFLFLIAPLFAPHSIMATTLTVGTCQPGGYTTISAAVAAAPSGAIVKVCPGTYPEQVVISTSLTLEGITSGNADRAVITVPASGFPTVVTSIDGSSVTPQLLVTIPGVNITNITVDGTGASVSIGLFAGIMYESGSSGIVKGVATRNMTTRNSGSGANGAGIWAENGNATNESVTIENSSVYNVNQYGIFLESNKTPPSLTATILKNQVAMSSFSYTGISATNVTISITSNFIAGGSVGITLGANTAGSITSNTVSGAGTGIQDAAQKSLVIKSNVLWNSTNHGIDIFGANSTIESNIITMAPVGIEFNCSIGPNTVNNNIIGDSTLGLDQVPSTVVSANTYDNVDSIRITGNCGP